MADLMFRPGFRFYQSANADAGAIKEDFIIREQEYGIILDDIRSNPMKGSVQHYLLLGRRGSGKSTLLKRIQVEIDTDKELQRTHIAINLAEEQANIYKLHDLLESVIQELEYRQIESELTQWKEDEQVYSRDLFKTLHNTIDKSGKKLVLLLDNIDRIFENLDEDAALLREYLLNYDDVKIIGGSTRMTEHFWKYNRPFYEFFRVLELKPLTSTEIKRLLLHWAEKLDLPPLKEFVEHRTGQLETIRILTDGLPRTLQFFVDILLTHTQETGYEYLRLIMDMVTPLYQERLNSLPPAQRKIVLQMAFIWEAAGTKELAAATKMDNKVISAQLKQLSDKGIADKIETNTKNHLYRLSERFFNLWLIFTQGNPQEKRKAKYLTVFLENFYAEDELTKLAAAHLGVLKNKNISPDKAVLLSKAYAQLKCISHNLRDSLISSTLSLKEIDGKLKQQLPLLTEAAWKKIKDCVKRKEWNMAIQVAKDFEQDGRVKDFMFGYIYEEMKDYASAQKYYLAAESKGDIEALNNLANVYLKQAKYDQAEEYYLQAIRGGNNDALNNLATLYEVLGKNDLARSFYLQAMEKGDNNALYNFSVFSFLNNFDKRTALTYINKAMVLMPDDDKVLTLWIKINLWNGKIELAVHSIIELIRSKKYNYLFDIFIHLLIHRQNNLVLSLCTDKEFGMEVLQQFQPMYYAAAKLVKDENMVLKIPPEMEEAVAACLRMVEAGQVLYYGNA